MDLVDLRRKLTGYLVDLEAGKITVQEAKARALIAHNIISTFKVELVRAHMIANGAIEANLPKLSLAA